MPQPNTTPSFEQFMLDFRAQLYHAAAIDETEKLADTLFQAYETTHQPGHLIERISMTPAGAWFCTRQDRSGLSDRELWQACCDDLSLAELLELMQSWVPDSREKTTEQPH